MKQDRRGSWYLLTGAIIGVAAGLFYSWVISPVKYIDAPPYALRADYKDDYRALVAAAYLYNGDLLRAEDRLAQLKDDNPTQSLALQAQQAMAEGRPEEEVRALGLLTMALAQQRTPEASSIAPTPGATSNPPAGAIPSTVQGLGSISNPTLPPTSGSSYVLQDNTLVCNPDQPNPMLQVLVQDAAGQPVASVELVVTWEGGEDHFFTGLQPELGLGYADFQMTPEIVYSLSVAAGGQVANDLTAAECLSDDQSRYWGSWLLTFTQR